MGSFSFAATCFVVLFVAQGMLAVSSLRLLTTTSLVTENNGSRTVEFVLEYEAAAKPTNLVWYIRTPDDPLTATNSNQNGTRTTSVSVVDPVEYMTVGLQIGDVRSQYFDLHWSVPKGDGKSRTLNLDQVQVTPGTDLAYKTGENAEVTITVNKTNGNRVEMDGYIRPFGRWVDPDSGDLMSNEFPMIPFMSLVEDDDDEARTTTLIFQTNDSNINGYFTSNVFGVVRGRNLPVEYITEMIVLNVHEEGTTGPFPDDFLKVEFSPVEAEEMACIPGYTYRCELVCLADGNAVKSVKVFKTDGNETEVPSVLEGTEPYFKRVLVNLSMTEDFAGTYECRAELMNGITANDSMTMYKLEKEARIENVSREFLDNGDVSIECQATGSQPLDVYFSWSTSYDEPLEKDNKTVIDVTNDVNGDVVTTKAILRPPFGGRSVFCDAGNAASYDSSYIALPH